MSYSIQSIQKKLSIPLQDLKKCIELNGLTVNKADRISEKSYKILVELLKHYEQNGPNSTDKDIHVLNGNHIRVNNKPFYESEYQRVAIFKDDAINFLKGLPDKSVDVIITDPAYSGMNQKLKLGSGKIIGKYKEAGKEDARWFEEFHDTELNYKVFLQECLRVMKDDRHIYIMFDSYSLLTLAPIAREIFEVKNLLCWDKVNIGLGHYFRRRHEFILFASKGKRPLNSKSIPDVWKIKRVLRSDYPTQKPTEVFELMLKGSANRDFVVCDPFLGSGSSAIAAIKNNCKFLGCDISEKSMSFSKERIKHFLETGTDKNQPLSLIGNDDNIIKLFANSKPQ